MQDLVSQFEGFRCFRFFATQATAASQDSTHTAPISSSPTGTGCGAGSCIRVNPVLASSSSSSSSNTSLDNSMVVEFSTNSLTVPTDSKPAILCIHGLASNRTIWRECGLALASRGYAVAYCDLVGHGDSSSPLGMLGVRAGTIGRYNMAMICDHLAALLARLRELAATQNDSSDSNSIPSLTVDSHEADGSSSGRIVKEISVENVGQYLPLAWANRRVIVVGHSYGASIALELGIRCPDLVGGIVCVDGGFINLARLYPDFGACIMKLCPPPLFNMSFAALEGIVRTEWCRGWSELGIQSMLNNFRELNNIHNINGPCNVEPKLASPLHVQLLQNFWYYNPLVCASLVTQPVLLLPSKENANLFTFNKREDIDALMSILTASNGATVSSTVSVTTTSTESLTSSGEAADTTLTLSTAVSQVCERRRRAKVVTVEEFGRHDIPAEHPLLLANEIMRQIEVEGFFAEL
jgi:pimeloyl-ACP methyl ester carboxylesterase